MAEVLGRLISDLHPSATVRMVFLQHGGRYERPHTAKNLDIAEKEFINTLGVAPDKAATLRVQLERGKMADPVISVDAEVAATVRNHPLRKD